MKASKTEQAENRQASGFPAIATVRILSHPAFVCLALAFATSVLFWPVTHDEFVNLDDPAYITANHHVQQGLNWANVAWAFGNLEAGFWHPLTWLSLILDFQLYGLSPGGHHLTSLLLHVANTILLFVALWRMTTNTWRSAFVAALFALHPLHVESVAWAADRKDVLSTFFALLALWAYGEYARRSTNREAKSKSNAGRRGKFWYAGAVAFFACSVMSKTMVVTLPLVLFLLDRWPLNRHSAIAISPAGNRDWRSLVHLTLGRYGPLFIEKVPFLLISLLAGLLTLHAEHSVGALASMTGFPLQFRAANAIHSTWKYLEQMCWPRDLAVYYPYAQTLRPPPFAIAALGLVLISALAWRTRRARPYLAVGWVWYLLTLSPVSGLIQVGSHARADRYTYVPLIGVFIMLAWGACDLTKRWRRQFLLLAAGGALALFSCAWNTRQQLAYWQNSETLFRHALDATKNNAVAYYCLGVYLSDHGQVEEATRDYELALQIDPGHAEAHNDLGIEIAKRGKLDEAIWHFHEAIRLDPRLPGPHGNLGLALALQRNFAGASAELEQSLRLKPDDAPMQNHLGDVLAQQGKFEEAIENYRRALRSGMSGPEIHLHLGMALAREGRRDEASAEVTEALRLKPDYVEALRARQELAAPANLRAP